jgi:predicted AlkP superfamily phosphohydrolase/phosphomutase
MNARRVIVLGLDGLAPPVMETMLARAELPNFARLRQLGCYRPLQTTYPAQTPVAWSTFATGVNPGAHGIFDFICRDPQTYQPDLALSRVERPKSIFGLPRMVNRRKGIPLWELLAKAEVPSIVLRCPCTFPPDTSGARMLAGVGVPDLRGGQGTGSFYTQDGDVRAKEHENVIVLPAGDEVRTYLIGPRDTRKPQAPGGRQPASALPDVTAELKVRVKRDQRKLTFEIDGTPKAIEVAEHAWGPWVQVKFKVSMLQSIAGLVRFYVRQLSPNVEFYVSPVNFDPAAPLFPVSAPADYAQELVKDIGLFSTLGMAEDHNAYDHGRCDEEAFLTQCDLVFAEREKMMTLELKRFTEGFFFVLFDTPDRVQHMLWRWRDHEHPGFCPELAEQAARIDETYLRCDQLVGRVLEQADENTLLMVLSDHGFGSFRRAFDTNTWLWQQGLLKLQGNQRPNAETGTGQIDWSKTYAYAVGLGGIYLNLQGRESAGMVEEGGESERVRKAIETGLAEAIDPDTRRPAVASVSRREQIYSGAYVNDAPDLLVNFCPGVRVSWQSSLGGFADAMFEDNTRCWSGDHIFHPPSVPGILFLNRLSRQDQPQMADLAPTILGYLKVRPHEAMEGESLL